MRPDGVECQDHLRYRMLYLGVVGHRPAHRERGLLLDRRQGDVAGALCDAVVDIAEAQEGPGEEAQDERVDAACRNSTTDVLVGYERAVQYHVIAARSAHAHRVPGFNDAISLG